MSTPPAHQSNRHNKFFIAYSKPASGHDRDNVQVSDYELLNYHAPSFIAAITEANAINGEAVISSSKIMNDLLRHDLGFQGTVVSYWKNKLHVNPLVEKLLVATRHQSRSQECACHGTPATGGVKKPHRYRPGPF